MARARMGFRMQLLAAALIAIWGSGCARLHLEGSHARLAGALWWMSPQEAAWSVDAWQKDLDEIQALGMDTLVFTSPYGAGDVAPGAGDPPEALLRETDRRGMAIYLSTLQAANWWTLPDAGPEIARAAARAQIMSERYGDHASFRGFYIPYECYVMWGDAAALTRRLYVEVAAACKVAAPAKRTMISPFFILDQQGRLGDFRWATPEEYQAFWTGILGEADIDIVALQDSGEHLACYTFEQRAPFFQAMKAACDATNTEFWANVETGELNVVSMEDYVARFGLKTHVNDPATTPFWRGVPAEKLVEKLTFVRRYTPTAITWGYREFVRPVNGPMASELYVDYYRALRK